MGAKRLSHFLSLAGALLLASRGFGAPVAAVEKPSPEQLQFFEAKRLKEHRQRVAGGGIGRGRRVGRQDCDPRQIGGTPRAGLRTNGGEAKPTPLRLRMSSQILRPRW